MYIMSLRYSTVLFFVTIVFDEVRPKALCFHTTLIIVCCVCSGARTVKNFYFAQLYHLKKAS